jgi:hypothetical protein
MFSSWREVRRRSTVLPLRLAGASGPPRPAEIPRARGTFRDVLPRARGAYSVCSPDGLGLLRVRCTARCLVRGNFIKHGRAINSVVSVHVTLDVSAETPRRRAWLYPRTDARSIIRARRRALRIAGSCASFDARMEEHMESTLLGRRWSSSIPGDDAGLWPGPSASQQGDALSR